MLKKLTNSSVRGSDGFLVSVVGIHEVRYSEGQKTARVEIEGGRDDRGEIDWYVYSKTFQGWLPPYEQNSLSREKKQEILKRISESLTVLGMHHRIE